MFARLKSVVRAILARRRFENDMSAEMRFHVDAYAADLERTGLTPDEARRRARVAFGGVEHVKERARQARGLRLADEARQDLRYAWRVLLRNPFFTFPAVLSLAIGVGATTAIFTVANGLLLRSSPGVADPDSLMDVVLVETGGRVGIAPSPYPVYAALRDRVTTLQELFAYRLELVPTTLRADDRTERVFAGVVTSNYFQALGVPATIGRVLNDTEDGQTGQEAVAVISFDFWTRRFQADPNVAGRVVHLDGRPVTIVGVAREGFHGTGVLAPDVWLPIDTTTSGSGPSTSVGSRNDGLMIGGRLASGVSKEQADAEIRTIGSSIRASRPLAGHTPPDMPGLSDRSSESAQWRVERSSPIPFGLRLVVAGFLSVLMGIVGVVLMIACANVAGVLLARAAARGREIAVRTAIGAARARIVRQLLIETLLLFAAGGASGLLLARWLVSILISLLPAFPVPVHVSAPLDARVVAFSLVVAFVAALLSGLAPARHAARTDVMTVLKNDASRPTGRLWLRHAFVAGQVAFSILLVVVAGLLVQAVGRVSFVDRGFDPRGVVAASIDLSTSHGGDDGAVVNELLERLRALPSVEVASAADRPPDPALRRRVAQRRERGDAALASEQVVSLVPNWHLVEPGYFETLRMPLVGGRDFTPMDRRGAEPVVIVSDSAARRLWPDRDAVGQPLEWGVGPDGQPGAARVVGVVRDLNYRASGEVPPDDFYVPFRQQPASAATLLLRSSNGAQTLADLRAVVAAVDSGLIVTTAQDLQTLQAGPVETQLRIAAAVAGSVGLIGVLLAAVGIYGVTAYVVTQRTREFGIRLALGAERRAIVGMVLRQAATLVGIGALAGLALSLAAAQMLASSPMGGPHMRLSLDILVAAMALFAVTGFAASYMPARRAGRVDPVNLLKAE